MKSNKPIVLFLCAYNQCRSQIGEALLRDMTGDRFVVQSAGLEPAKSIHPLAIKVMAEIRIDISKQTPKSVNEYLGNEQVSYLLVVGNRDQQNSPHIWPGILAENRYYWPVDDPTIVKGTEQEIYATFQKARDDIKNNLERWLEECKLVASHLV